MKLPAEPAQASAAFRVRALRACRVPRELSSVSYIKAPLRDSAEPTMAQESPVTSLHLFQEVRVETRSETFDSVVQFRPPSSTGITFTRTTLLKRSIPKKPPALKTEAGFARCNLATESNVFFSGSGRYPRSFLWRVLNDGLVLEMRSVDLSKSNDQEQDASYVLQFVFTGPIRPSGIAFADSQDEDTLSVFVLAASNELYTLTLKRTFFCSAEASEIDLERWCKVFKPGSLNFTTPHCFLARSSLELILGLNDGRVVRLTRRDSEDGSVWHDVIYNDGKWGSSLRSLVRWQGTNTVSFDGTTLEKNTPQALALSPDNGHLWVVCLDHSLKVWNLEQGRTVYRNDLLGVAREPYETANLLLDPGNQNLIQTFSAEAALDGDRYYVMTYSPHDLGQFKIWAVRDADAANKGIRDLYPESTFRAPDPDPDPESKTIWKMVDFKTKITKENDLETWLLMRSNRLYKLYSLKVPLADFGRSLSPHWRDHWTTTTLETLESILPPQISDMEPEGIMDSWIDFLLGPAKYPENVIELALVNYTATRKPNLSTNPKASLRERIQTAVSSSVQLQRLGPEGMDFAGYRTALEQEWTILWQEVRGLNNSRWEVLSLAYDDEAEAPWLAFTGGCSSIRKCNKTEIVAHNDVETLKKSQTLLEAASVEGDGKVPILPDELAVLVGAAADFRKNLNSDLRRECDAVLTTELWQDPSESVPLRIQSFYDRCKFSTIETDAFLRLESQLQLIKDMNGFDGMENALFEAVLKDLPSTMSTERGLQSTRFGLRVIVRGAQEMISLHEQILFDLLLMVIVIEMEVDRNDYAMERFDAAPLYVDLLHRLKQYQVMQWLAKKVRLEPPKAPSEPDAEKSSKETQKGRTSTILQNLFAMAITPRSYTGQPQTDTLTQDIQDVLVWITGMDEYAVSFDDALAHIQCNLLLNNNIDLASSFLRYQPSTPWATYLKGRLYLIRGEFTEAAIYLKKAAFKLCEPAYFHHITSTSLLIANPYSTARPSNLDYVLTSSSLLSESEASHLGHGLPAYYTHVQTLFHSAHCPSYVATFARLVLQFTPNSSYDPTPLKALFHASISTAGFPSAFSALARLSPPNAAELIPTFLTALLAQNAFNTALILPWPPALRPHIDTFLSSKAATAPVSGPQYNKLLAAWRMQHLDYRGAAAALLSHLQRVRKSSRSSFRKLGEMDEVIATHLNVINSLACAGGEGEAWVLTDAFEEVGKGGERKEMKDRGSKKRKLVTIKDVRASYQRELDRRSVLESGRWGFGLDGAGEEDEEMGEGMDVDSED